MPYDDMFDDHISKCRVCFRKFSNSTRIIDIDTRIQQSFQLFTSIDLKSSKHYSNKVCSMCEYEISRIIKFRETISERQMRLYEHHPETGESDDDEKFQVNEVVIPEASKAENVIKEENCDPTLMQIESIEEIAKHRQRIKLPKVQDHPFDISKNPPQVLRTYVRIRRPKPKIIKPVESIFVETKTECANIDLKDEDEGKDNCMIISDLPHSLKIAEVHSIHPSVSLKKNYHKDKIGKVRKIIENKKRYKSKQKKEKRQKRESKQEVSI